MWVWLIVFITAVLMFAIDIIVDGPHRRFEKHKKLMAEEYKKLTPRERVNRTRDKIKKKRG